MELETPKTRSKNDPGSSQGRVTWAHDQRWKIEWLANQDQELVPPTPTQVRPVFSMPASSTPNESSSSRPAKRRSRLGRYPSGASGSVRSGPLAKPRQSGSDGTSSSHGTSGSDPSPNNLLDLLSEWETLAASTARRASHSQGGPASTSLWSSATGTGRNGTAEPSNSTPGRTRSAPDVIAPPAADTLQIQVSPHAANESTVFLQTPAPASTAKLGQKRRLPSQKTPSDSNIMGGPLHSSRPLQLARTVASPVKSTVPVCKGPAPRIGIVSKTRFSDPKANTPFKPPTFTSFNATPSRVERATGQTLRSSPRNHAQRRLQNAQTPLRISMAGRQLSPPTRSSPRLRVNTDDGRPKEAKEPSSDGLGDESFDSIDFADESNAEVLQLLEVLDRKCGRG